jgi:hypothetical protein
MWGHNGIMSHVCKTSTIYYVLVSINVIMLLIISWNINIPRQFNNQWNHIRSIMARCNNIILYDSADQWILTYQLSRSHDQGGRKLPPQKFMCGSFRPPISSRSEILLMYKLHSVIFTMQWSSKTILKGTFVC